MAPDRLAIARVQAVKQIAIIITANKHFAIGISSIPKRITFKSPQ